MYGDQRSRKSREDQPVGALSASLLFFPIHLKANLSLDIVQFGFKESMILGMGKSILLLTVVTPSHYA